MNARQIHARTEDERLHLSASVVGAPGPSVVGTMWAMADEGGRDLANHFQVNVLGRSKGYPITRDLQALGDGMQKLQRKQYFTRVTGEF